MRLIHYAKTPLVEVRSVSQGNGRAATRGDKPNGLWVSVKGDDDWPSWCRAESFALDDLAIATEVVLRPEAKVLHIADAAHLVGFHQRYSCPHPMLDKGYTSYADGAVIDWQVVAAEHDAIVIAPYQWEHRLNMEMMWYYGWDCASGCIWNRDAVERLISIVDEAAEDVCLNT